MPKPRTHGFNKEKVLLLLGVLALLSGAWWFWNSCPESLQTAKALSTTARPIALKESNSPVLEPLDEVLARSRKSPFAPGGYASVHVAQERPIKAPLQKPQDDKLILKPVAMRAVDKELEVKFMGVIWQDGQVYALLSTKDGVVRAKEGDVLKDQKYRIVKIEKQSIEVTDEDGKPWVLHDGAFESSTVKTSKKAAN